MIRTEAVSGLLLDEANPRFSTPVDGQDEAITALLLDAPNKLVNLAKDIVKQGAVNPTELPIVVDQQGELIVIEGNRRVAVLKLLNDPNLARDAAEQFSVDLVESFKKLQKPEAIPTTVQVYVAPSRADAQHWVELRHTGENDGVGVLEWASWQANNFRRRRGSQADRAALLCDAVERDLPADADLLAKVSRVRQSRLTTLGRLVADPHVRLNLGFDFKDDGIVFYFERDELQGGIRRIFTDLADDLTVTAIKTKPLRIAYVNNRAGEFPDQARRLPTPRFPGSAIEGQSSEDSGTDSGAKPAEAQRNTPSKRPSPKEEKVIFSRHELAKREHSYLEPLKESSINQYRRCPTGGRDPHQDTPRTGCN